MSAMSTSNSHGELAYCDDQLTTRNVLTIMRPLVPDPSFVLSTFVFEAALSHKG